MTGRRPHPARPSVPAPFSAPLAARLALALLAAVALLIPGAGIAGAPPALAADTDVTLVTDAAYEVHPDDRLVHVTVRIMARNHRAETKTRRFYAEHAYLAVQPGVSGLRLGGAPGAKVRVARRTAAYTLLRIDFGKRLYGGSSRAYTLAFDLRDAGSRKGGQVRIGGSLASFPVWAYASDGAKGSTVTVEFPAGYDVHVERGTFDRTATTDDGGTRLTAGPLASPTTWFAVVLGEREASYADTPLSVPAGAQEIPLVIRAWDEDPAWARRVGGLLERALPALAADTGLPWPDTEPTIVREAATRSAGGHASLFDPAQDLIEIAYWADDMAVLHGATHGWFNGGLLADRWANEGFASLFAERAAAALDVKARSPELSDEVAGARIPLNAWPAAAEDADPDAEAYGYAASLTLAREIAARAGDAGLRAVLAAAAARIGAYQPPATGGATNAGTGSPGTLPGAARETLQAAPDWRALLDLLEEPPGSDFTDLWRTWVVREDEAALLDARAEARHSYERTLALADGWALPVAIRDALRAWQFESAERLMADARTVLAQRTAVEARSARHGVAAPATMRWLFEAGRLPEASREAEAELNALLVLEGALAERHEDADILTRIGMLGEDPESDVTAARAAFEAGSMDRVLAAADGAFTSWNGAWQEGRRRALFAVAVLATVLVLATALGAAVRRARRSRA
jgi:hypothetical protein